MVQPAAEGERRGASGAPPTAAVLMRGITKRFPAVVANDGVDFEAAAGEVHALLGENGAGKRTLPNIPTGLYRPDDGDLILDEPTAVLTPQEAEVLFATLREMAADGRTIVFISHKLHEVKAVADRVTILRAGRKVETLGAADATPRELATLMVGRGLGEGVRAAPRSPGEPVLAVEDVWAEGDRGAAAVKGVSLSVRGGEIVAVAGVAGNGQRELAETIAGMRSPAKGAVRVAGKRPRSGDPRAAISAGVAYVPEDRLGTRLSPGLSVPANFALKSYPPPSDP